VFKVEANFTSDCKYYRLQRMINTYGASAKSGQYSLYSESFLSERDEAHFASDCNQEATQVKREVPRIYFTVDFSHRLTINITLIPVSHSPPCFDETLHSSSWNSSALK
jgi:hypothetical protein